MGSGQVAQFHQLLALAENEGGNVLEVLAHLVRPNPCPDDAIDVLAQALAGFQWRLHAPDLLSRSAHLQDEALLEASRAGVDAVAVHMELGRAFPLSGPLRGSLEVSGDSLCLTDLRQPRRRHPALLHVPCADALMLLWLTIGDALIRKAAAVDAGAVTHVAQGFVADLLPDLPCPLRAAFLAHADDTTLARDRIAVADNDMGVRIGCVLGPGFVVDGGEERDGLAPGQLPDEGADQLDALRLVQL